MGEKLLGEPKSRLSALNIHVLSYSNTIDRGDNTRKARNCR